MFKVRNLVILLVLMLVVAVPVFAQDATPAVTPESASGQYTVSLGKTDALGEFLVGPTGMTLYIFTVDPLNDSACYDQCAKAWPPLTVSDASALTQDEEVPGVLGTITRKDGTLQVTYNGQALYYWFKDKAVGDTTGNRVGNTWWVVPPATISSEEQTDLGSILVGAKGMTVYTYTKDTAGTSTCTDKCATSWPPVTVSDASDVVSGVNLPGKLGTITRADGTLQVTYNDMPLYYFAKDQAIGDAMGEAVGTVWYTVHPETLTVSNSSDLGDFLIDNNGMTVYTYSADTAGVSNCTGDCLKSWPAVTVGAKDKLVAGANVTGTLATITRDDGSLQVTYNGMPLYFFAKDAKPGDTTGNGVGGKWSVVKPA